MSYTAPSLTSSRIVQSDRSVILGIGDDADVTDWDKGNEFIVCIQVNETMGPYTSTYKIQWQDDASPGFVDLAASGAALIQGTGTALVDGTDLTEANARCTNDTGDTWQNGEEVEGNNTTDSINLADERESEFQFAVDPAGADAGHTYSFRLVDAGNGDAEVGICAAQITIASAQGAVYDESVTEGLGLQTKDGGNSNMNLSRNEGLGLVSQEQLQAIFSHGYKEPFSLSDRQRLGGILYGIRQENLGFSDSSMARVIYNLSRQEPFSLEDLVQRLIAMVEDIALNYSVGGAIHNESVSEILKMTALQTISLVCGMNLKETVKTVISEKPQLKYERSLQEAMSLLESISGQFLYGDSFKEVLTVTDQIKASLIFSDTLKETSSLYDNIRGKFSFSLDLDDSLSLVEILTVAFLFSLPISEMVTLEDIVTETIGQIFNEALSEVLGVTDSLQAIIHAYVDIRETTSLLDAVQEMAGQMFDESLHEAISLQESVKSVYTFVGRLTEKLCISDTLAISFLYALAFSDVVSLRDESGAKLAFNLQVNEYAKVSDVMSAVFRFGLIVTENLSAGDIIAATVIKPSIEIRRGKAFLFTVDVVHPKTGVTPRPGVSGRKVFH